MMAAMVAAQGRGRNRTRKDLPYAFIGAGSATQNEQVANLPYALVGAISATQNEKVPSLDSGLAEVQIWLIALVICQTVLA